MKIYGSIDEFTPPPDGVVILIGKADGLHLGHIALINETINLAFDLKCDAGILSLVPDFTNPIFRNGSKQFVLTLEERRRLLENWPLQHLIYQPMTTEFTDQSAESFVVDKLHRKLKVKGVVVGWDFLFGQNREGNVGLLQDLADELGFFLKVIDPVKVNGVPVKTTLIRELIEEGNFYRAQNFLGYPFFVTCKVIKGKGIGHKLSFPTANLDIPPEKFMPGNGIYIIRGIFSDSWYWGLASIGNHPTIVENGPITTEVWLRNFSRDIVGEEIKVEFFKRLRSEQKFPSVEALVAQMGRDSEQLEDYIKSLEIK